MASNAKQRQIEKSPLVVCAALIKALCWRRLLLAGGGGEDPREEVLVLVRPAAPAAPLMAAGCLAAWS